MIHQLEIQVLILLLIASLVGVASRRLKIPYTLALVVAGLLLGFVELRALHGLALKADLLLLLLLPPLLFEAAFHIEWKKFRRMVPAVLTLALLGVLIATAATAGLAYAGISLSGIHDGFSIEHAFLFASVIAATDPISVLALFKELGVTKRLYLLVEGESLLNDGIAVVVFVIVMAVVGLPSHGPPPGELNGAAEIAQYGFVTFIRMALGGALVGAVIGGAVAWATRHLDDHLIETTMTLLVAYGSFLVAEELHTSGVLATVVGGLLVGSVGAETGMSPTTKHAVEDFWEFMAFFANSFIFLLVGLELKPGQFFADFGPILIGFVAVCAARAVAVYGCLPISNRFALEPIKSSWGHVMVWGGLRGSLSMVLILTLPESFPGRDLLVNVVFGVVALSLFVQGLTMKPLLAKLGLLGHRKTHAAYESARADVLAAGRGLTEIETLRRQGQLPEQAWRKLDRWYRQRLEEAEARAAANVGAHAIDEQIAEGMRRAAVAEREALRRAMGADVISDGVAYEAEAAIIDRLELLESAENEGEAALTAHLDELLGRSTRADTGSHHAVEAELPDDGDDDEGA